MNRAFQQRGEANPSFDVVRRRVNEVITERVPALFAELITSFQPKSHPSTPHTPFALPPIAFQGGHRWGAAFPAHLQNPTGTYSLSSMLGQEYIEKGQGLAYVLGGSRTSSSQDKGWAGGLVVCGDYMCDGLASVGVGSGVGMRGRGEGAVRSGQAAAEGIINASA